eukprot:5799804-Pyramimonas_sp.AAC.1
MSHRHTGLVSFGRWRDDYVTPGWSLLVGGVMVMSCGGLFWQVAFGQKLELESEAAERMMELKQLREAEKQREGAAAKLRSDLAAAGAGGEELAAALASREAELTAAKKQ